MQTEGAEGSGAEELLGSCVLGREDRGGRSAEGATQVAGEEWVVRRAGRVFCRSASANTANQSPQQVLGKGSSSVCVPVWVCARVCTSWCARVGSICTVVCVRVHIAHVFVCVVHVRVRAHMWMLVVVQGGRQRDRHGGKGGARLTDKT